MPQKVATLEKVSKTYGKGDLIVKALDNINLEIYKGDYLAVMGASGSGKSTAMNIIGCLDRPTKGVYKLNDIPVENLSELLSLMKWEQDSDFAMEPSDWFAF